MSLLLVFAGAMHSVGCVITHVRERSRIVRSKAENLPSIGRPVIESIRSAPGGKYRLRLSAETNPNIPRAYMVTREFTRTWGKDFDFVFFYFAFAVPGKGPGGYLTRLLLGIPFTLGVNLVIAAGDWISLPFRLGAEEKTRTEYRRMPVFLAPAPPGRKHLYFAGRKYALRGDEIEFSAPMALRLAVVVHDDSSARRLTAKADINHDYGAGNTLLHFAAIRDDAPAIRLLLRLGARPNARNGFGRTPLHFAARRFSPVCARLLLDAGADPNARDGRGRSPLFEAVAAGNEAMLRLLLERGASTESRDVKGLLPADLLHHYPFSNRERLLRLLGEK